MELDAPVDTQQLDGVAPSISSQPASGKEGGKDPERFYCPYPGCNRSFAELWRLKVHFRAPPDIRGSGKERGHGTELTHCPKCGKTLKPGKHHVGCSGSKTNARQAPKRARAGGEAEPPDDALTTSPTAKQLKIVDADVDPLATSWQEYARSHGALHQMVLPSSLKQEQQEWSQTVQAGIIYGPNGAATACWLPSQVNGFVPQLPPQGYTQPQYASDLQFSSSAHGYPQQVPSYPSLPGYSPPSLPGLSDPGQVLSMPGGGSLQQLAAGTVHAVQAGSLGALNPVLYQQHPHDTPLVQSVHLDASGQQHPHTQASTALPHMGQQTLQPPVHSQQQQQPPPHQGQQQQPTDGAGDTGSQQAGRTAAAPSVATGTRVDGGGTSGAAGSGPQQQQTLQQPAKATTSDDSLGSVLGDVEEFTRDFGRIPSPPPLPADFHSASTGGNGVLFNFAQFGQKLPRSQSHTRLDKNLSAVGLGIDSGLESDLLYDHSDDGDLMQLLFGIPDELPTMATIHLHKWSNEDPDDGAQPAPGAAGSGVGPGAAASHHEQQLHLGERSSSQAIAVTSQPEQSPQRQQPGDDGEQQHPAAGQPPGHTPQATLQGAGQQSEHSAGLANGKSEALGGPEVHSHVNGVESYLTHGAGGGGGKAVMAQLVNGMSAQSHVADEHHRDHLLDAETFRLLQSCD